MEFTQFHPTCLWQPNSGKQFLISEALRGEGAILETETGQRFMQDVHPLADLAPRDIVARAIYEQLVTQNQSAVYLNTADMRCNLQQRFPTIYKTCESLGIHLPQDRIPVWVYTVPIDLHRIRC
jgi:L-aspartate oxidase